MTRGKAGINPLGEYFTFSAFSQLVEQNASHSLKQFLLDHDILATVNEEQATAILQNAQLEPDRSVDELSEPERRRFHREIRDTLGQMLEGHHGYDTEA